MKGVTFDKDREQWRADIRVNYKSYNLGRFKTKREAEEKRFKINNRLEIMKENYIKDIDQWIKLERTNG